jgi:hypothetical protein
VRIAWIRSDLSIDEQVVAKGSTWPDRQLLAKDPPLSRGGFGAEVRDATRTSIIMSRAWLAGRGSA